MTAPESIVQGEAPEAVAERIGDAELAKLLRIRDAMLRAREQTQEVARQAQQAVASAQEAATKAAGAFEYLVGDIREQYVLGERDAINEDGTITRG